jgi:hypothetical protein
MSGTERCPRASASWRQSAATQSTSGRFGAKQTLAAAAGYRKPWISFARQKFTGSGFDERSNYLQ